MTPRPFYTTHRSTRLEYVVGLSAKAPRLTSVNGSEVQPGLVQISIHIPYGDRTQTSKNIVVSGRKVNKNGFPGKTEMSIHFTNDGSHARALNMMPDWLAEVVEPYVNQYIQPGRPRNAD